MRSDRTQTRVISELKEMYGFLATSCIDVMNLVFAKYDVVWISRKYRADEDAPSLRHTNDFIGAFFTAGARTHQYRYVDRLRKNAKYCHTYSAIYIQRRDEIELIETGDKLGNITSELGTSEIISECVIGGTKNYQYRDLDTVTGTSKNRL